MIECLNDKPLCKVNNEIFKKNYFSIWRVVCKCKFHY